MYKGKKVIHIVARGFNGEIGVNNKLLWCVPEDMKYFKESTIGHVVLMGRKTFESLPKQLEGRIVVEVSNRCDLGSLPRDNLVWSFRKSEKYSNLLNTGKIFIAGGAKLYNSTFDIVDELWITQIEKEYLEADTFYRIPTGFRLVDEVYGNDCESVGIGYSFQKWVKIN